MVTAASIVPTDATPFVNGFPSVSTRVIFGQWVYPDGSGVVDPPTIEYLNAPYFLTVAGATLFPKKITATMATPVDSSTNGVWYAEVVVYDDPDVVGDVGIKINHALIPNGITLGIPKGDGSPLNYVNALPVQGSTDGLMVIMPTGTGTGSITQAQIDSILSSASTDAQTRATQAKVDAINAAATDAAARVAALGATKADLVAGKVPVAQVPVHTSALISDFTEAAQDAVNALLVGTSGVTLSYDDTANTLTITGPGAGAGGGLDAEAVRDAIGVALLGSGMVAVTVNDAADTITISGSQALVDALALKAPLASPAFTGTASFTTPPTVLPLPTLNSNSQLTHKKYVDDAVASVQPGGSATTSSSTYEIPTSQLVWVDPLTATQAQKLAAADANSAAQRAALIANPGKRVVMDLTRAWYVHTDINEITDATVPTGQLYRPVGRFIILRGDRTSSTDVTAGRTVAAPVLSVTRRAVGTAFVPTNIRTITLGGLRPNTGASFTTVCSAFDPPSGYSRHKAGRIYNLTSADTYDGWSKRAGYGDGTPGTGIYKGAMFPVAGVLLTVTGQTFTALNSNLGLTGSDAITTLEGRILVGGTSGATALVQGGDFGGVSGQLVVNSVSKDFTAGGEQLKDQATGVVVATFVSASVLMSGVLDDTYTTTPYMREMSRSPLGLGIDLTGVTVEADGDPDDFVPSWNRADAVYLAGCADVNFGGMVIRSGYAAGVVVRSCWNWYGKIVGHFLPNHALEDAVKQGAYGYLLRVLGASDHGDVDLDAMFGRHAITSNGIRNTFNQDSRTGQSTNPDLSTNFWSHGPGGRNVKVTGIARNMYGTGFDTHEGSRSWLFDGVVVIDPNSAGRSTTSHDGITLRGFDMYVRNPYMRGVRIGVNDQSAPLNSGFVYTNTLEGGTIEYQLYGWAMSEDAYSEALSRFRIKGTTFKGDLTVSSAIYQQSAIMARRGNVMTEGITSQSCNYAHIRHTSYVDPNGLGSSATGHAVHIRATFDWTDGTATRQFSQEATWSQVDEIDCHTIGNPVDGARLPLFYNVNSSGNTAVRYTGQTFTALGSTKTEPTLSSDTGGTPSYARIAELNEPGGGSAGHPTGTAPTVAVGTNATGATVTLTAGSTDVSGEVVVTMGATAGTANGPVAVVTFGTAFGSDVFPVVSGVLNSVNRSAGVWTHSATSFSIAAGNALAASTAYKFSYYVSGV